MTIAPQEPGRQLDLPGRPAATGAADRRRAGRAGVAMTVLALLSTVVAVIAWRYEGPPPAPSTVAVPSPPPAADPGPRAVLDGPATVAPDVRVSTLVLPTNLPGGRVTGLSDAGVAVGVEGRPPAAGVPDERRAVRWDGRRAVPLPTRPLVTDPLIAPDGTVVFTASTDASAAAAVSDGRLVRRVPVTSATGAVDADADGRVLVRQLPGPGAAGFPAPGTGQDAVWRPDTGELIRLDLAAGFLLDDDGVVGTRAVDPADPAAGTRPVLWRAGRSRELPVPAEWRAEARDGAAGVVVGTATRAPGTPDGPTAPVLWRGAGGMELLPALGGQQSGAVAVNPDGLVAGTSQTPRGVPHAVVWQDGAIRDLGSLTGGASSATGVSVSGAVAGWSQAPGGVRHAVAWVRGGIVDLGALNGAGVASSAHGIVGNRVYGVVTGPDGLDRPALWQLNITAGNP